MAPVTLEHVLAPLDAALPELEALYIDLHRHPELSFAETRTAAELARRLERDGYEVHTGIAGTGVLGVLRNGEGPTVLLRADIDALPVEEKTGLSYASTARGTDEHGKDVPVMHACGHDMHATWLSGARTAFGSNPDAVALGQRAAEFLHASVGSQVAIGHGSFQVMGIMRTKNGFEDGGVFMPLASAQAFFHKNGTSSVLLIKLKNSNDQAAFKAQVKQQYPTLIA